MSKEKFVSAVNASYNFSGPSIYLGAGVYENEILANAKVNLSGDWGNGLGENTNVAVNR